MVVLVLASVTAYAFGTSNAPVPVSEIFDGDGVFDAIDGAHDLDTVAIYDRTYAIVAGGYGGGVQIIDITNPTNPIAVSSMFDGRDGFDALDTPSDVDTIEITGTTYALVAGYVDNGIQIINVTNPASPIAVSSVFDGKDGFALDVVNDLNTVVISGKPYVVATSSEHGSIQIIDITNPAVPTVASTAFHGKNGFDALYNAEDVHLATISGSVYAIVTSDNGIQIVNITNPSSPTAVSSIFDGRNGFDALNSPDDTVVVTISGNTYAVVTGQRDDGIQIVNITNPASPTAVSSIFDGRNGFDALDNVGDIDAVVISGHTYVVSAASHDDGVQITNITNPASPTAVSSMFDGKNGFDALDGANGVDIVTVSGRVYAVVASFTEGGVQIIDITTPASPTAASGIINGTGGFDALGGVHEIAVAAISDRTYAVVVSDADDAVQIIDITVPSKPLPTASVFDGDGGFDAIDGASDLDTVTISDRTYAIVAGGYGGGVQIIDITTPTAPIAVSSMFDGRDGFDALDTPSDVDTIEITGTTYALVAGYVDNGIQIINVTNPASPIAVSSVFDGKNGFALDVVNDLNTVVISGKPYAVATSSEHGSIQIIDITNPAVPTVASTAFHGKNGFDALYNAEDVHLTAISGSVYAIVTSDNGIQIVNITNPSSPTAVSSIFDGRNGFDALNSPDDTVVVTISNNTYAVVTGQRDDGIQIVNITNPASPTAVSSVFDGRNGFDALDNVGDIDAVVISGHTYVVSAASHDDGVQITNITNPASPTAVSSMFDGKNGFDALDGANGVDIVTVSGRVYAVVASFTEGGVQIIDITTPASPTAASGIIHGTGGFDALNGAQHVETVVISGQTYAVVASEIDDGLQIIDITTPSKPLPTASIFDGRDGFNALNGAQGVDTVVISGMTYAVVPGSADNGVQIVNITNPAAPTAVSSVFNNSGGFDALVGAHDVITVNVSGRIYAIVTGYDGDSVQIIDITNPSNPLPAASIFDGKNGFDALDIPIDVDVMTASGRTYAVVASRGDDGVQIIDITNPSNPLPAASIFDGKNGFDALDGANSVAMTTISNNVYATVASNNDGIQIMDVTNASKPVALSGVFENQNGFDALNYSRGLDIVTISGRTYALVASLHDNAVQIMDITPALKPAQFPPVLNTISNYTIQELSKLTLNITATDADIPANNLTYSIINPPTGVTIHNTTGVLTWAPTESQNGMHSINVTVSDGIHSDSQVFTVTVYAAVPFKDTFDNGMDGWRFHEAPIDTGNETYCKTHNTGVYSLTNSSERGGSAYVNSTDKCWFGDAGGIKTFTIPSSNNTNALYFGLDYRSVALGINPGVGHINNMHYVISDSLENKIHSGVIYLGERSSGLRDTGWRSYNATIPSIDPSKCPCTIFVGTGDGWLAEWNKAIYFDNVNLTATYVAPPITMIYPIPISSVFDGKDGFDALDGATVARFVTISGTHYAVVTSDDDKSVQIINITNPASPTPVSSVFDGKDGFDALDDASDVRIVAISGLHYAVVVSHDSDGVQIINITNPASPTAVSSVFDGKDGFDALDGANDIDIATISGQYYAVVAGWVDSGVQIINITNPASPTPVSSVFDGKDGFDALDAATDIRVAAISGQHYAVATGLHDDGVQIINITNPASPTPVSSVFDGKDGFDALDGAGGIVIATLSGQHYVLVSGFSDDGVQIINITNPASPTPVSSVFDDQNGFDALDGANEVDVVTISGRHYAVVTGAIDNGVQIMDITNPASPTAVSSAFDGKGGFDALNWGGGVDIATISGKYYALLASYRGNAVQIMELSPTLKTSQFPPVLNTISNHTIPELSAFTLNITATDADTPANNLTYNNATNLPTGSSLNTTAGVFTWTPAESQDGIHSINVTVSDGTATDSQTFTITVREVNTPPVLAAISNQTAQELSKLTLNITATDTDIPANNLTYSITNPPSGVTIHNTTGIFAWTPTESQNGIHSINVTVYDGNYSNSQVFTVTVYAEVPISDKFSGGLEGWKFHQIPNTIANTQHCNTQNTDVYTLSYSSEHGGSAFVNYTDMCWFGDAGAIKTFTVPPNHNNSKLSLNLDYRSLAAAIDPGIGHVNNMHYAIYDSSGTKIQDSPIFQGEVASGLRDTGWRHYNATISLINASQCPCELFIFTSDGWKSEWNKSIYFDNVVIVSPHSQSPPTLNTISNHTIPELSAFTLNITATDTDTPTNNLTYSVINPPSGVTIHNTTGVFTWTPTESQDGIHHINVTVYDGTATDSQTFTITVREVNTPPVLAAISNQTAQELSKLTLNITATDTDIPANNLTYSVINPPSGVTIHNTTGILTWTPTESQNGIHSINVTVYDGNYSNSQVFAVTVYAEVPISDKFSGNLEGWKFHQIPNTIANTQHCNTQNTDVYSLSHSSEHGGSAFVNYTDMCWFGDAGAIKTFTVPPNHNNSKLSLNLDYRSLAAAIDPGIGHVNNMHYAIYDSSGTKIQDSPIFQGEVASGLRDTGWRHYNATISSINASQCPCKLFIFTSDGWKSEWNKSIYFDNVSITLDSKSAQTPPVLNKISNHTIPELSAFTLNITATDTDTPTNNLTYSIINPPTGVTIQNTTGVFAWTPTESQNGIHSINVTVSDGTATDSQLFTITVREVNTPPVLAAISNQTAQELSKLTLNITATDTDIPANNLTYSIANPPTGVTIQNTTGVFAWTPTESQNGIHSINVTVSDGTATDSQTFTITVREVNTPPVLAAISNHTIYVQSIFRLNITATDTDIPANTLTYGLTLPPGASINTRTGVFTWLPSESQIGTYRFNATVSDGTSTDSQIFTVTVRDANSPPVLNTISNQTIQELSKLMLNITATDADIPTDTLSYSATNLPAGASININTGTLTWTPAESQDGTYTIQVTVSDGTSTDSQSFTITVREVNTPPTLNTISNQTIQELSKLTLNITATDADIPTNTLSYGATNLPTGASININTGTLTWTPAESQDGTHTIQVTVSDGTSTDSQSFTITVQEVNTPPTLNTISNHTVQELSTFTLNITATDTDIPANTLSYGATNLPTGASININTGTLTWTPAESQDGTYTIQVTVSDGTSTDSQSFTITVREVNSQPTIYYIQNQTIQELSEFTLNITATDADIPANTLTYGGINLPAGASINASTGMLSWTPAESQDGTHTIQVSVSDGTVTFYTTITITVQEVNSPPVLNTISNQTIQELSKLTLNITATDTDIPTNTLSYGATNLPTGASININTGTLTWTPAESQVGTHTIQVTVSDGTATASQSFTITVRETN